MIVAGIPGVQGRDIARHNLFDQNFTGTAFTQRGCLDVHHGQQLLHGAGCAMLLPEAEQAAGEDYGKNDESVDGIVEKERQACGKQEQQNDRTFELSEQERERVRPLLRLPQVGAITREALPRFFAAQSFAGRAKLLKHLRCADAPKRRETLTHPVCYIGARYF